MSDIHETSANTFTDEFLSIIRNNLPYHDLTRKINFLLVILDISGSMQCEEKLPQCWEAVRKLFEELALTDNSDAKIESNIMLFNDAAQWIYPAPMKIEDIKLPEAPAPEGMTSYASVYTLLNNGLSDSAQLQLPNKVAVRGKPVILLLSDGHSTDDFSSAFEELKTNQHFVDGARYAFSIGNDADKATLAEFTGSPDTVFGISKERIKELAKIVKAVSSEAVGIETRPGGKKAVPHSDILKDQNGDVVGIGDYYTF